MKFTAEQLHKLEKITEKEQISNFDDFEKLLHEDLCRIIRRMESSSDKYFVEKEDDITTEIVGRLYEAGWTNVQEQTKEVGSVDIHIEFNGFKWICEAKRNYGNLNLFEGLLQLTTRYAKNQDRVAFFIYHQKKSLLPSIKSFHNFLTSKEWVSRKGFEDHIDEIEACFDQVEIPDDVTYDKTPYTIKVKKLCGSPLIINIFWADFSFIPLDKSGRQSESIQIKNARLALMTAFFEYKKDPNLGTQQFIPLLQKYFKFDE
ncbi:hypothetical protein LY624_06030 [Pseudoalteromonas sp. N1230-9]|uniref:hypothetical protein n=1 Tax=unclassified Pseudoalteromonas TaxID=194690 RepID=UPI001023D026|nr:hypothetical protein EXT42_12680 [Pseudoalteromonas sp. CO302Y]RZG08137.1 hypothetical protein EXT40_13470 [Pseudoalteromonas sp. CO133X]WOC27446.1 hypothetical protein LY624_06030 [Pseudoalteromonas sp. N1230-9]